VEDISTGAVLAARASTGFPAGASLEPEWMVEDSGASTRPPFPFSPVQFSLLTADGRRVDLAEANFESMVQGETVFAATTPPATSQDGFAVDYGGSSASSRSPVIAAHRPIIDVVAPLQTLPGRRLTILGGGFGARPGRVAWRGLDLAIEDWSAGEIQANLPEGVVGGGMVVVTRQNGLSTAFDGRVATR
jgi:hypothetical protein